MISGDFEYQKELQKPLSSPYLRLMTDTVEEHELFIFPFLAGDLLNISQMPLSAETRKEILQDSLRGLAYLQERSIIHTGTPALHSPCPTTTTRAGKWFSFLKSNSDPPQT